MGISSALRSGLAVRTRLNRRGDSHQPACLPLPRVRPNQLRLIQDVSPHRVKNLLLRGARLQQQRRVERIEGEAVVVGRLALWRAGCAIAHVTEVVAPLRCPVFEALRLGDRPPDDRYFPTG